ncbi:hypothetical protein ACKWTF_013102 [Chironomus riparius]
MVERRTMIRWAIDVIVYAVFLLAWNKVDSVVPKVSRPFVCGDKSLSLPYKRSTIRGRWLHYYFYGTVVLILAIEFLLERKGPAKQNFIKVFKRVLRWFKYYFISFICVVLVSSTIKNLYGSLRPFFFEVCKPDAAINCTGGTVIAEYKCTSTEYDAYTVFESQRSFPSGHTYSVFFSSIFLISYIQARFSEMPSKLLVVFIHSVIILWTSFCCVTRISDNWHRPADVIGACLITLPIVVYCSHILCKNFKRNEDDEATLRS